MVVMTQPVEPFIGTSKVAALCGVSLSTVARWADEGRIPHLTTPGGWRKFRKSDVDAFIATLENGTAA